MLEISIFKKYKGQTLVEIILAVAVAITVIVALVTLAVSAMRFAQSSMMRSVGEKLAAGGIEAVRIKRNSSVDAYDNLGAGHYFIDGGDLVSTSSEFSSISYDKYTFSRKIDIGTDTGSYKNIFVEVRWQEGAGDRKVYLSSRIYKY
ncbi:hypothetical protein KJ664_01760 [Patescibacteria group bacterium]|nr:hypothetical protein [Patescibacteria group bacterium]